jgi:hypothetical protein
MPDGCCEGIGTELQHGGETSAEPRPQSLPLSALSQIAWSFGDYAAPSNKADAAKLLRDAAKPTLGEGAGGSPGWAPQ